MNRNLSLILSAVIVVILLAVWVYLLLNPRTSTEQGTIEGSGSFSEFEFGDTTDGSATNSDSQNDDGLTGANGEYNPDALRQLTSRKVIGYQEVLISSSTHIYFMESGVGHVYSINLSTGVEERVTATTIPDARESAFSQDGATVAIKTGDSRGTGSLLIGTINLEEKSLDFEPFVESVANFKFIETGELLYATVNNSSVSVSSYDFENNTTTLLFTTPFRESVIILGDTAKGPHYFYPKTSHLLEGFVYKVENGTFERLMLDGYALTALGADNLVYASLRDDTSLTSVRYDSEAGITTSLSVAILPDKCTVHEVTLLCAVPSETLRHTSVDEWYKGNVSFSDNLWEMGDTPELLIDITSVTGRRVDVFNGTVGAVSSDWYFQNKADDSLWIYELSTVGTSN